MSPRARLAAGTLGLALLGILAASIGARRNRVPRPDPRRSSYLTGPDGARGLAQALPAVGTAVAHWRRPFRQLPRRLPGDSVLLAVLAPSVPLDLRDGRALVGFGADAGDLVIAGMSAAAAIRCFGFVPQLLEDSLPAQVPGAGPARRPPRVGAVLARGTKRVVADSSDLESGVVVTCAVPPVASVDTLLRASNGRPVALRLHLARSRHTVALVADGGLFRNETVRSTEAGPVMLALLARPGRTVYFDEYHHGFVRRAGVTGILWSWSWTSPWGWAFWQLAVVGLLALVAGGLRFGRPRRILQRRRRSPLEHGRALATALAAAQGHDTAVRLMIRGLRRRLSRAGRRVPAADEAAWLASLRTSVRTEPARQAVDRLQSLTEQPQDTEGVLAAANAVEDVWEDLKP